MKRAPLLNKTSASAYTINYCLLYIWNTVITVWNYFYAPRISSGRHQYCDRNKHCVIYSGADYNYRVARNFLHRNYSLERVGGAARGTRFYRRTIPFDGRWENEKSRYHVAPLSPRSSVSASVRVWPTVTKMSWSWFGVSSARILPRKYRNSYWP